MSTTRITITTAGALILAGVLALGACSTSTPAPDAAPTASSAAVTATATPVSAPTVGATVTSEADVAAAKSAGLAVYTTNAGTQVVVDPSGAVPQVVLDDAKAAGDATVALQNSNDGTGPALARKDVAQRYADGGGKKLVFIVTGGHYDVDGSLLEVQYAAQCPFGEINGPWTAQKTVDKLIAVMQQHIDQQKDPSQYEIVNLAG